jgi:hypothetical protein
MKTINYRAIPEFDKDFKHLKKRFLTLPQDLEVFKKTTICPFHIGILDQDGDKVDSGAIVMVPGCENEKFKLYKVIKFPCKTLKNRGAKSGIRLIYAFYETETSLELIQIYFKADDENMDYDRAREYMKQVLEKNLPL